MSLLLRKFLAISLPILRWHVCRTKFRVAPVRFGSVAVWGWKGSTGSGFRSGGSSTKRVFLCFTTLLKERTVPVPFSVPVEIALKELKVLMSKRKAVRKAIGCTPRGSCENTPSKKAS